MRNVGAARLAILSLFFAAVLLGQAHALAIGIPAFNPSTECNALFSAAPAATTTCAATACPTGTYAEGSGCVEINSGLLYTPTSCSAGCSVNNNLCESSAPAPVQSPTSNAQAQSYLSNTMREYGLSFNIPGGAVAVSAIALMVSFLVIAIGFIISKLIPAANVSNWLQREYWEVTKSAVLIAVVFSAITIVSSIGLTLNGYAGPTGVYASNIQGLAVNAENYLCTVNNEANLSISNFAPFLFDVGLVKSITLSYSGFPIPPVPLVGPLALVPVFRSGVSGVSLYQSLLISVEFVFLGNMLGSIFIDFVLFLVVPIKIFYSAQVVVLPFLMFFGIAVLLPIGLMMRALPLVRGVGGTLIAFGIGVGVIWPAILILFNAPISGWFCTVVGTNFCTPLGPANYSQWQASLNNLPSYCPSGFLGTACSTVVDLLTGTAKGAANVGSGVVNSFSYLGMAITSASSLYPSLNMLIQYNLYLDMQFYILSLLDLMIFYALTDNLARMLGGTIRINLGRKLKLI